MLFRVFPRLSGQVVRLRDPPPVFHISRTEHAIDYFYFVSHGQPASCRAPARTARSPHDAGTICCAPGGFLHNLLDILCEDGILPIWRSVMENG